MKKNFDLEKLLISKTIYMSQWFAIHLHHQLNQQEKQSDCQPRFFHFLVTSVTFKIVLTLFLVTSFLLLHSISLTGRKSLTRNVTQSVSPLSEIQETKLSSTVPRYINVKKNHSELWQKRWRWNHESHTQTWMIMIPEWVSSTKKHLNVESTSTQRYVFHLTQLL